MASSSPAPETDTTSDQLQELLGESEEFPCGYGDFILQSSDNILFYFPRAILAHVSPFFKDMFSIGDYGVEVGKSKDMGPLFLDENSNTLTLLLRHIDPLMESPTLDSTYLSDLLKAAHKYQIDVILNWFKKEAHLTPRSMSITTHVQDGSLLDIQPLLALSLADYAGLDDIAKLAVHQLIKGRAKELYIEGVEVRYALLHHIHKHRKTRQEWYEERISKCITTFKADQRSKCDGCRATFYEWCLQCTHKVHDKPAWDSVDSSMATLPSECDGCIGKEPRRSTWIMYFSKPSPFEWALNTRNWKKDATEMDSVAPDLPN